MKTKFIACLAATVLCTTARSATYYCSLAGNTTNSGTSTSATWSLAKVNTFVASGGGAAAGDTILFKRGDVFPGALNIARSGSSGSPITFGAYNTGAKPLFTGLTTLSSSLSAWTLKSAHVYEYNTTLSTSALNIVLLDSLGQQRIGRTPNFNSTDKGYSYCTGVTGQTAITDSGLPTTPTYVGGEVVIRSERWKLDRCLISAQSGHTITYTGGLNTPDVKTGYFIQNHIATLDLLGEYCYTGGKLTMHFGTGDPTTHTVQISKIDDVITTGASHNIVLDNLAITGANRYGINMGAVSATSADSTISNCDVSYSGLTGINVDNHDFVTVDSNTVDHSNNNGIEFDINAKSPIVTNNVVSNTNTLNGDSMAGMGQSGDGQGEGIIAGGEMALIDHNTVTDTGYVGIQFDRKGALVQNNVVQRFDITKDDGGGIYSYQTNRSYIPPFYLGRIIQNNIVLDGIGAPMGTTNLKKGEGSGIYLDGMTSDVTVKNNTVANMSLYGYFSNSGQNNVVQDNLFYNCQTQFFLSSYISAHFDYTNTNTQAYMIANIYGYMPSYDFNAPGNMPDAIQAMRNNVFTGNTFFAKSPDQICAAVLSESDDVALAPVNGVHQIGQFGDNCYARPLDMGLLSHSLDYQTVRTATTFPSRSYDPDHNSSTNNSWTEPGYAGFNYSSGNSQNLTDTAGWNTTFEGSGSTMPSRRGALYIPRYTGTLSGNQVSGSTCDTVTGWTASTGTTTTFAIGSNGTNNWVQCTPDVSTNPLGSVYKGVGNITAGQAYILKASVRSNVSTSNQQMKVYLREGSPYKATAPSQVVRVNYASPTSSIWTDCEMLFVPTFSSATSTVLFQVDTPDAYSIDNVYFYPVTANTDNDIKFTYNATDSNAYYSLPTTTSPGVWLDSDGISYKIGPGYVTIPPFSGKVLTHAPNVFEIETAAGSGSGFVSSSGGTVTTFTDSLFSGGTGTSFTSAADTDYLMYKMAALTPGRYRVYVGAKNYNTRGNLSMKGGVTATGTFNTFGKTVSQYSATALYEDTEVTDDGSLWPVSVGGTTPVDRYIRIYVTADPARPTLRQATIDYIRVVRDPVASGLP